MATTPAQSSQVKSATRTLDIIEYVERGIGNSQDLIVMQKRR